MFDDKIGNFIKMMRKKKGISQEKLSELLFVDRTLVSKWENNRSMPSLKDMKALSKIFGIHIEELMFCEEYSNNNEEEIKNNLSEFIILQDNKIKNVKKIIIGLIITILVLLTSFLLYYFYQTYNKTRVYLVTGKSDNYELVDGILFITRERTYLKIGNFNKNIERIKLVYYDNGIEKSIYEGDPNTVIIDFTGYNGSINLNNFDRIKNDLYMYVYDENDEPELMKINFIKNFFNDNLIYSDSSNLSISEINNKDVAIPDLVKKSFTCDNVSCSNEEDGIKLMYDIYSEILYMFKDFATVTYDVENNVFTYESNNSTFSVINDEFICDNFDCNIAKEKYNQYNKYIIKYFKNR